MIPFIPFDVPVELRLPPFGPRLRCRRFLAAPVAVPVASVDKDDRPVFGEHDVGFPGELFVLRPVHGETEPEPVEYRADDDFRFGVLVPNPAHIPGAAFGGEVVCHRITVSVARLQHPLASGSRRRIPQHPCDQSPPTRLPLIVPFFEELEAFFPLGAGDEDFLFE